MNEDELERWTSLVVAEAHGDALAPADRAARARIERSDPQLRSEASLWAEFAELAGPRAGEREAAELSAAVIATHALQQAGHEHADERGDAAMIAAVLDAHAQPRHAWLGVALALAACVAPLVRRISLALALAGVVAQVLLVLVAPPPDLFAPLTLAEEWRRGPLFGWLVPALERLTPLQLAIAVAIVALCLVLVGFDHRRSRAGDDALDLASASLFALLGALGLVALLEAALRSSFAAALVHWSGMLALLGLLLAWLPALAQAHQRWQMERRAAQPTTTPPAPTSEHAS